MPLSDGATVAAGTVWPFAAAIDVVGAEFALAVPAFAVAVTETSSSRPTSVAPGVYVSSVAPGIAVHATLVASQLSHWYVNATGFAPFHVPPLYCW